MPRRGMNHCFADFCSEKIAAGIFDKARKGAAVSPLEHSQFASFMMLFFGHLDAKRGWTKQWFIPWSDNRQPCE